MKRKNNQTHNRFNKLILLFVLISLLLLTNASAFLLGGDGSSSFFNGTIDELVIYNRSLTLAEVEKLYTKGFNSNGSCDIFYIEPDYDLFSAYAETTNFFEESDLSNVTNLSLATALGRIKFPEDYSISADTAKYDDNVIIGDCFVSVNTLALDSTFNATAFLTLNNSDGHCGDNIIYEAGGFPSSADEIRTGNQKCIGCSEIQRTGNFVTRFKVNHFSAYAIGSNTRLDIYDEYEDSYAVKDTDITFYANYTNYTSGDHIGGVDCIIEFDDNPGTTFAMTDNGANYNFTKVGGFSTEALHTWNVTCSNATGGWNTLNATDDVQVGTLATIPEFSVVTLGLGLIAVLAGLIVIRKRR
ncbi:MAG: hypothetical protein U9R34_07060 [Nanoarchaeota archaeon]|nr:hypothetical protein [Nanoarchaeota archaeon]